MTQNLLHLNGVTYDTQTGNVIRDNTKQAQQAKPLTQQHSQPRVDGFVKPKLARNARRNNTNTPQQQSYSAPQKSQTLARQAVQKPDANETIKQAAQKSLRPISSQKLLDFTRIERASKIKKHPHVTKFQQQDYNSRTINEDAPRKSAKKSAHSTQASTSQPHKHTTASRNQKKNSSPTSQLEKQALESATSHTNTYESKTPKFKRLKSYISLPRLSTKTRYGLIAILVTFGLGAIIYSSAPVISYEIASTRSGMNANRPGFTPNGFMLDDKVDYDEDSITLRYSSVADDRSYTVHQEKTEWNSEALRNGFVDAQGLYQSITNKGKTIYLYNQSSATWVDGGVWYTIDDMAGLNTDQVLRIANSL